MSAATGMTAVAIGSWAALVAGTGGAFIAEYTAGMAAPLTAALGTWTAVRRAFERRPERVQAILLHGFAIKLLFFSLYLTLMLRGFDLRPAPFVLSFTGYFLGLYVIQAVLLHRLFQRGIAPAA